MSMVLQHEHKIQSRDSPTISIELSRVPKALGVIRHFWLPRAMIVSFKLETDDGILIEKAMKSIDMYQIDCVIANLLHNRKHVVRICSKNNEPVIIEKPGNSNIEDPLINKLVSMHSSKILKGN